MAFMRTVTGDVPIEKMGFCQPHEHIFVEESNATDMYPALLADDPEKSTSEVELFASLGGGTIIDAQPVGAGGYFDALYDISQKTGVYIVASTGFHLPMFYPPWHRVMIADESELYEAFVSMLDFYGVMKVALGKDGLTDDMLPRFRAAGRAAAERKVPVLMHTEKGFGAVEAVELLGKLGVDPKKVLVCHADRQAEDYSVHETIARTGAILEYDTIGRFKYHDDESEIALIKHMLDKGYKLTLSLDTTSQRMISYSGKIGLGYIIQTFIPALLRSGVSQREIDAMTRDVPAGVFM